ncbi:hypothetical protein [Proteus mirabilis]|uniref:hypothetical protein n=1 Tax=Proteus mirabilis TaxID=584 RepID=UPI0034D5DBBB
MDLTSNIIRLGNFSLDLVVRTGYRNFKSNKYNNSPFYVSGNFAKMNKSAYVTFNYFNYELDENDEGRKGSVSLSSWDLSEALLFAEEINFMMNNFDQVVDVFPNVDSEGDVTYQIKPEYREALVMEAKGKGSIGFQPTLFKRRKSDESPTLGGHLIIEKNACVVTLEGDEWITLIEVLVDSLRNLATLSNSLLTTYMTFETMKKKSNPNILSYIEEE